MKNLISNMDKALFERGLQEARQSSLEGSMNTLLSLEEKYPDNPAILGSIGAIFFERGDYQKSEHYFREVTKVSPHSERASLCLFHSLIELGQDIEALEEMKRYTKSYPSEEYSLIYQELRFSYGQITQT